MQLKSKITTNMNFPTNSSSAKVKMSSITKGSFAYSTLSVGWLTLMQILTELMTLN